MSYRPLYIHFFKHTRINFRSEYELELFSDRNALVSFNIKKNINKSQLMVVLQSFIYFNHADQQN